MEDFTYFGSTISSNLFLDAELNTQIGKAVTAMAHLAKRVWENSMLTNNTKMKVYQACVLSKLLHGSEAGMDSVLPPRMQTQCLPPTLPQKDFGHHLAGLCPKQECPGSGRNTKHVCLVYLKAPILAWSHQPHAGWTNPQGHAVWQACHCLVLTFTKDCA